MSVPLSLVWSGSTLASDDVDGELVLGRDDVASLERSLPASQGGEVRPKIPSTIAATFALDNVHTRARTVFQFDFAKRLRRDLAELAVPENDYAVDLFLLAAAAAAKPEENSDD